MALILLVEDEKLLRWALEQQLKRAGHTVLAAPDLASAVNALLSERSLLSLSEHEVRQMIGDGASMLVRRVFLERAQAEPDDAALPRFIELYGERCLDATVAYPGIPELVRWPGRIPTSTGSGSTKASPWRWTLLRWRDGARAPDREENSRQASTPAITLACS